MGGSVGFVEVFKHRPDEFGGFQTGLLSVAAISERLCCARFCGNYGKAQMQFKGTEFGDGFRIVCGRHALLMAATVLEVLGDSSPTSQLKLMAAWLGVEWNEFLQTEPKHPATPESFSCLRCGGGFIAETTGMFSGKRYIHTCGE